MSSSLSLPSEGQSNIPLANLSYECLLKERGRESVTYLYEVACSITHLDVSAYLSIRITSQNTYRGAAPREVPFTRHETGVTTYVELLEAEQLEVRIVEQDSTLRKASYSAQKRELMENCSRQITSMIHQINSSSTLSRKSD